MGKRNKKKKQNPTAKKMGESVSLTQKEAVDFKKRQYFQRRNQELLKTTQMNTENNEDDAIKITDSPDSHLTFEVPSDMSQSLAKKKETTDLLFSSKKANVTKENSIATRALPPTPKPPKSPSYYRVGPVVDCWNSKKTFRKIEENADHWKISGGPPDSLLVSHSGKTRGYSPESKHFWVSGFSNSKSPNIKINCSESKVKTRRQLPQLPLLDEMPLFRDFGGKEQLIKIGLNTSPRAHNVSKEILDSRAQHDSNWSIAAMVPSVTPMDTVPANTAVKLAHGVLRR